MHGHDSAVHPDVRIALRDHRCIGEGICLVCKAVQEWQRAEGGRTWTLSREDRARLAVAIMKAANDVGNPITQVHVARMLNVHKSQISRDIRDLVPDSEGRMRSTADASRPTMAVRDRSAKMWSASP
ncbi:hypothetical protein [Micromonospora chalcea]|uniref:hypothetical protein n=1 Tax=Micromonospora chalcea TaxID=1874 RepID=UPI00157BBEE0|nr:hypothetical protein [Micromonospora chalcea]